jgi:dephospho-CoA kinase
MFSVGLTGGIGSGKSVVAELLAARGAAVIDTDVIAHEITAPGGVAVAPIRAAFGDQVIDASGALDRPRMRERVFADPAERKRLEAIVHPLIRAIADEQAASAATAPYVVFAVPLLVESGSWAARVDRVLVIDCPLAQQLHRVVRTRGLPYRQVQSIIAQQATREQRLAVADDMLVNAGSIATVAPRVARLHASYCAMAARARRPASPL